jgi:lysophospholipase L1-like esterase
MDPQQYFSKDNSHPNEKGHQLWAEELSKDLQWIK